MNPEPSDNPYVSPQTVADGKGESSAHPTKWLRICANGILVIGWIQIFIVVVGCVVLPIVYSSGFFSRYGTGLPSWLIVLELICLPVYLTRTLYMIHGAKHLHAGTNYRAAKAAAILAALGILFPFSPYEVPFGIWALILLRKEKVKQLFEI